MFAVCARTPLLPGVPLNTKHLLEMPFLKLKQYNTLWILHFEEYT